MLVLLGHELGHETLIYRAPIHIETLNKEALHLGALYIGYRGSYIYRNSINGGPTHKRELYIGARYIGFLHMGPYK